MNLKRISSASVAVMAAVGALRLRRPEYADAVMERPGEGVTADFIKGATGGRDRLADLAILLDLAEALESEMRAEAKVSSRTRLAGVLRGLQAAAEEDPEDMLGRIRFGRYGQWFPVPRTRVTKAELLLRAHEAVERGILPGGVLRAISERVRAAA